MKTSGFRAFTVAFVGIAALGGIAYYLEKQKRELDWSVDQAFKEGGWLAAWGTSAFPSIKTPTAAQVLRAQPRKV